MREPNEFFASEFHSSGDRSNFSLPVLQCATLYAKLLRRFGLIDAELLPPFF
jgi:hypothetical protein